MATGRRNRIFGRLAAAASVAALGLLAAPSGAAAATTIGQAKDGSGCATFTLNFTGDAYQMVAGTPTPIAGSTTAFLATVHGFELNVAATLTAAAPPPPPTPASKADCADGGWQQLTDDSGTAFKNEGDCVSFVATGGRNTAGG